MLQFSRKASIDKTFRRHSIEKLPSPRRRAISLFAGSGDNETEKKKNIEKLIISQFWNYYRRSDGNSYRVSTWPLRRTE